MGAATMGGIADPRLNGKEVDEIGTRRDSIIHELDAPEIQGRGTIYRDSSIMFEDYRWWAQRARDYEKSIKANAGITGFFTVFLGFGKKDQEPAPADASTAESTGEKRESSEQGASPDRSSANAYPNVGRTDRYGVTEVEWQTAQRAARTASWGAIFYLITTDILGPYSIPYAFAVSTPCDGSVSRTDIVYL